MICLGNQTHTSQYLKVRFLQTKVSIEHFLFVDFILITKSRFWTMRKIHYSPDFPKTAFSFTSLDFQTFISQPPPSRFLPSKSHSKTQHLETKSQPKNRCFLFLHQYLDSPKTPMKSFNFSRISNSYITKTTGFISSIKSFLFVEFFSPGKMLKCIPCISVLTVRKFQEVLLFFR